MSADVISLGEPQSWRLLGEGGANAVFAYTGPLQHLVRALASARAAGASLTRRVHEQRYAVSSLIVKLMMLLRPGLQRAACAQAPSGAWRRRRAAAEPGAVHMAGPAAARRAPSRPQRPQRRQCVLACAPTPSAALTRPARRPSALRGGVRGRRAAPAAGRRVPAAAARRRAAACPGGRAAGGAAGGRGAARRRARRGAAPPGRAHARPHALRGARARATAPRGGPSGWGPPCTCRRGRAVAARPRSPAAQRSAGAAHLQSRRARPRRWPYPLTRARCAWS